MIVDLARFVTAERPGWSELEALLQRLEENPDHRLSLGDLRRFHYLYERTSASLAQVRTFASEPELRRYLESLVARAYGLMHDPRGQAVGVRPWLWLTETFPRTFRRHVGAFWLAVAITVAGSAFGGLAVVLDPDAKEVLLPFAHLQGNPADRVAGEEGAGRDRLDGVKATFSSYLMTHNTRVAVLTLALGVTWAVGTILVLFYNGVILGAVAVDYIAAGQWTFLAGWLLPHGSFEIPAILMAGQAGLLLGRTLLGRGDPAPLGVRVRRMGPDLATLIVGVGLLLVWAGVVEAFFSQYHEPVVPYAVKITFGCVQLALLAVYLSRAGASGRGKEAS